MSSAPSSDLQAGAATGAPEMDDACRTLLCRAEALASGWGWERPGLESLLVALSEPGVLEPLLDELTRGVLEPEEADLLLNELRERAAELAQRCAALPAPEACELERLLEAAERLAAERQEAPLRTLHLARALLQRGLAADAPRFSRAEQLLLRRLALGPRLAGAPPAGQRIASIDLNDYRIRAEILDLLPAKLCRQHGILPLKRSGDTLYVATADPEAFGGAADVAFWAGCRVELVRVTHSSLEEAMARHLPDELRPAELAPEWQMLRPPAGAAVPAADPGGAAAPQRSAPLDVEAVPASFDRLQRLVDLSPQDQRYYGIRGDLYLRIRYLHEAAESYRKAAELSEERGDWPYAIAYLRKMQDISPADRSIYRAMARNFRTMGMHEELLQVFGTYADLSARADDFGASLELYCELTGRSASDPELEPFAAQGGGARSYSSYVELVSAFLTLLKFHLGEPRSRDLYYLHIKLGLCYTQFGFNAEAIAHYQKAVERCAPHGHPLWTVGVRSLWDGELARATELFLLALDESHLSLRDRLHIEYDLAVCCELRGDLFRAYQLFGDIRKVEEDFLATEQAVRRLRAVLHL